MNRSLLVASNSDDFGDLLAQQAATAGFTVVVAASGESPSDSPAGGIRRVNWNRRSPLSARALLVQAQNLVSPVTDIVYAHSGRASSTPFHEIGAAQFEQTVDNDTRGRLFFLKEALALLQRTGGGSLTLLLNGEVGAEALPLDAETGGAFVALGRALFTWYQNEPVVLRGFQSAGNSAEEFSRFAIEQIVANNPKQKDRWFKYSGKSGLFPFSRS